MPVQVDVSNDSSQNDANQSGTDRRESSNGDIFETFSGISDDDELTFGTDLAQSKRKQEILA